MSDVDGLLIKAFRGQTSLAKTECSIKEHLWELLVNFAEYNSISK